MTDRPAHKFLPPPKERDPEPSGFRGPGPRDRVTINGKTGSGKSTFALWLFAEYGDYDKKPWIFVDFKGEDIISSATKEGMFKPLKISAQVPKDPGPYVVRPDPRAGMDDLVALLWRIYQRGRCGVFLDEATMIPELRGEKNTGGPYQTLLSQGRSKEVPVWTLAQRPVNVNNMVLSENDFYLAFKLRNEEDLAKVRRHIPKKSKNYEEVWGDDWDPPNHWARWYDDGRNLSLRLRPCPPPDEILGVLFERLDTSKKNSTT